MSEAVLSVRNLTTRLCLGKQEYTVVDRVSFDVYPGETLALVGESGCGKSLLALSLLRILPDPPALPPTGEVLYQGENLLTLPEKKLRHLRGAEIAFIFQDPMQALNPVYTIGNQLMEVLENHLSISGKEALDRIEKALRDVGIPDPKKRLEEYPHQLSGGMKQRVMIAMALLCEPKILIADEPTTALDVTIQAQVLDLIRSLQKKRNMGLILITHDMGVVAEMADTVIVMYASQMLERGPVEKVFDKKAHPYTQGLFSSIPKASSGRLETIPGVVPSVKNFPLGCHFHPRCPKVQSICRQEEVPCYYLEEDHCVRCVLYDQGGGS